MTQPANEFSTRTLGLEDPSEEPSQQLRSLWERGQRPNVKEFLSAAGELAPAQVAAVLDIDQWQRWHHGERVPAEQYLDAFPGLRADPECAFRLVYGEFHLREQLGEAPGTEEYARRFPEFAGRLNQQVELHRALVDRYATAQDDPTAVGLSGFPVDTYELVEPIARGGMGVVYKARDRRLNRLVALKMILPTAAPSPLDWQRFRNEAEAAATLDHPHIVPIYEVGERGGRAFLSMKLIEGGSLAQHLSRFGAAPRAAALLLEKIARAVHYAHQRGVLHRDLKPANILVDKQGMAHLTDFGLAKRIAGDQELTQSGTLIGTPAYMAPEQTVGHKGVVTTASDVYGLGAVLYALLTGRPPFRGEDVLQTLEQVRAQQPEPPRQSNPAVERDLELICLKCLEKEPHRRYPSADALADELERYVDGKPLTMTRPVGNAERLWRWCRRNPGFAGLTSLVALLLLVVVVGSTVSDFQLRAANRQERASRTRAEENLRVARAAIAYFTTKSEDPRLKPRGLEGLQRDMWRQAKGFYEQLARQQSDDPQVEAERALALVRLGRVTALLGSTTEAVDAHRQAQEIFERLVRDQGDRSEYADGLAQALLELGTLHQLQNDWNAAGEVLNQALDIRQRLAGQYPEDLAHQARLCQAYFQLGRLHQVKKEARPARDFYEKALAAYEPLKGRQLQENLGSAMIARTHMNLGTAYGMPGLSNLPGHLSNREQAKAHYIEALRILDELDAQYPDVPEYQQLIAESHYLLGVLHRDGKQYDQARAEFEEAIALGERLHRDHKEVVDYPFRLSRYYHAQGLSFVVQGQFDKARRWYDQAASGIEPLAREHPSPDHQTELSTLLYDRACHEALSAAAVLKDATLGRADRDAQREQYCRTAIDYLRKAWSSGFKSYPRAFKLIESEDADLNVLRERPEFKALVADWKHELPAGQVPALP